MRKPIHLPKKPHPLPVLSEEDSRLFREAVGTVTPVLCDRVEKLPLRPKTRRKIQGSGWLDSGSSEIPLLSIADTMSYVAPGLPKKLAHRLRAGKLGLDIEMDLHGLTVDQARRSLASFLSGCLADGFRCLHLIHGKGYRSDGDYPILKNHINIWLRQHPDVLAFCSARPADGGTGAIYVLLRDRRKTDDFDPA